MTNNRQTKEIDRLEKELEERKAQYLKCRAELDQRTDDAARLGLLLIEATNRRVALRDTWVVTRNSVIDTLNIITEKDNRDTVQILEFILTIANEALEKDK